MLMTRATDTDRPRGDWIARQRRASGELRQFNFILEAAHV